MASPGQGESVLQRGTGISIGRSVIEFHIRADGQENHPPRQSQPVNAFLIRGRGVLASDQNLYCGVRQAANRIQQARQPLRFPVIAYHEDNERAGRNAESGARQRAQFETARGIEAVGIDAIVDHRYIFVRNVDREFAGSSLGDCGQNYTRIRVHVALEECAQTVIHAPVREQGPELPGVAAETQAFTLLFAQFRKNGVDADDIRIETIDSRGVNQARGEAAKMPVDPAAEMIGGKPPNVTQKMGPRRDEHAMPDDMREVYVVSTRSL